MSDLIRLSRFVSVGRLQPGAAELDRLRQDGVRSIVDLRTPEDAAAPLSPEQEAAEAEVRGLSYRHFPVGAGDVDDAVLDRFGEVLRGVERPVFVHCMVGRRAGMFALSQVAVEQGIPGDQMLEMARDLGVLYGDQAVHAKFAGYVDRCLMRPDPLAHRADVLHQHTPPEPLRVVRARWRAPAVQPAGPVIASAARREQLSPRPGQRLAVDTIALGIAGAVFGLLLNRRFLLLPLLAAGFLAHWWSPRPQPSVSGPDEVEVLSRRLRKLQEA